MRERRAEWGAPGPWDEVLSRIKEEVRIRRYSPKTYTAYAGWVQKFAAFVEKPPGDVGMGDVKRYLPHLAVNDRVVASTQNQAFNALLFLGGFGTHLSL